jgi:hypothetical protein
LKDRHWQSGALKKTNHDSSMFIIGAQWKPNLTVGKKNQKHRESGAVD